MTTYSPTARLIDIFLTKVDPLPIQGLPLELQWASRLALHKAATRVEFEKFSAEMLEVVLARTDTWPMEAVERADAVLRDAGCFTLSDLRRGNRKLLLRIMKQARIRNEKDYQLAKSAVDDAVGSMSDAMKSELERLLISFEESH